MLPGGVPLVVNPRGFRPGSVRNDTFFQALPMVLERQPKTHFACCGMVGQPEALRWVERLGVGRQAHLLPFLSQTELWDLFMRAEVTVSVSQHDGTPNSLLEAMACSCFPVAGDIESLREWITPGVNGLLVPPDDPTALAGAILLALEKPELRASAARANLTIIEDRCERGRVLQSMTAFYAALQPARFNPNSLEK
jgi:glycosyltransferase involved in cell wall biosynthesis